MSEQSDVKINIVIEGEQKISRKESKQNITLLTMQRQVSIGRNMPEIAQYDININIPLALVRRSYGFSIAHGL